jgi:hypothetical protein
MHNHGVVITARQPNPARRYEGLKYCHLAVHAVRVADYRIPHIKSHRCSVITKPLPLQGGPSL